MGYGRDEELDHEEPIVMSERDKKVCVEFGYDWDEWVDLHPMEKELKRTTFKLMNK